MANRARRRRRPAAIIRQVRYGGNVKDARSVTVQPSTPHILLTVPEIVTHGAEASSGSGAMSRSNVERALKGPTVADCP